MPAETLCPKCKRPVAQPDRKNDPNDCYYSWKPHDRTAISYCAANEAGLLRSELAALKHQAMLDASMPLEIRQLEAEVIRSSLEVRRLRNRLHGFGARTSTMNRELTGPTMRLAEALDKLAAARGEQ